MVNLVYSVIQLLHNLGAATVIAAPMTAWGIKPDATATEYQFAAVTGLGWTVQLLSGVSFGIASYYIKGQLPEVEGVALAALFVRFKGSGFKGSEPLNRTRQSPTAD